ncbi:MAG: acetyl-CoA carboxylase biotin carboxyl carrier protein [Acidobacteriota bacterium]|nr:acetyl-CoA carboxylase biotin carboxyl carrier protein [Blastocatellia bacterium]MDW8241033.1 acetyl-CoA carboxylase biotin carboxyl carrier protein [Acidobacteriota bacterium]
MDLNEIKQLIRLVDEKRFAEFELERGDFRLRIKRMHTPPPPPAAGPAPAPPMPMVASGPVVSPATADVVPTQQPVPALQPETTGVVADVDLHLIRSPMVGTFYRSPSPTAAPFVQVGDRVERGTVLCIVEAMKLMNEVPSDVAGEVMSILVENGQPVEYGQPLFAIKPSS